MTTALGLERSEIAVGFPRMVTVRVAVAVARFLAACKPVQIERTLGILARGAKPASAQHATRIRKEVVAVSSRCAGQYCLQRAIAVVLLSRIEGVWPDWCAGARIDPFMAHSWIEVDGAPVGEVFTNGFYAKMITVTARKEQG
ncbi:lasso peptide biosynthesis B2 protein [Rhodococcus pyridinivorans]|uniref:lasso peptide biosynthesis B2 protein n=1 Tax=Rhodococcus pyridinivorans TaxID=103816 RepID=UPI0026587B45|nr:lasso peptide biosynthesis B2 protein [Rhodococcus pyridinivorans]